MTIKHLVVSGGGPNGILAYGIASRLAKKAFWRLADIQSMYGCSIGAYLVVIFSLGYEWEWLDDYLIKRPWEKLVAASTTHLIDIYEKKCLINEHFFIEAITPLLRAKDLKDTITLKDLYDYNQIEIHMYASNINGIELEKIDLSYKTHPDLAVITSLRMTMAFPIIFEPIFIEDSCYIDGGLMNNFPLNDCIEQQQCATDEILALKNIGQNSDSTINEKSSIFDFFLTLLRKMQAAIDTENDQATIKYNVSCFSSETANFKKWADTLKSAEMRRAIVEDGYAQADAFLLEHSDITPDPDAQADTNTDANTLLGPESTIHELD
jgi:predicted acylesterase/phospholipase RssA